MTSKEAVLYSKPFVQNSQRAGFYSSIQRYVVGAVTNDLGGQLYCTARLIPYFLLILQL